MVGQVGIEEGFEGFPVVRDFKVQEFVDDDVLRGTKGKGLGGTSREAIILWQSGKNLDNP